MLAAAEKEGRNALSLSYDELNPFSIDASNLVPIYVGSPSVKCAYCSATYAPSDKGSVCSVCNMGEVGLETLGLVLYNSSRK